MRVPMIMYLFFTGQSVIIAVSLGFMTPETKCEGSVYHRPHPLIPWRSGPVPKVLFLPL
jgi:hypothetical protein